MCVYKVIYSQSRLGFSLTTHKPGSSAIGSQETRKVCPQETRGKEYGKTDDNQQHEARPNTSQSETRPESQLEKVPAICSICDIDNEITETFTNDLDGDINVSSSSAKSKLNSIPIGRGFKMAHLNIVSIPKHINEVRISMANQHLDLMAFNETRLDSIISNNEVKIQGYDVVRKDRSRKGGGVCIYLRNSINYLNRNDLVPVDLEAVCLEIIKPNSRPFVVVAVYRPPDSSSDFFEYFENLVKVIDNEDKELFILGDLNCDLLKATPDQPTKKLLSLLELYQLSQLIKEPTRITRTSSTLLDHFVTSNPEKITISGVVHTGVSDHSLIFAIRKINISPKIKATTIQIRNMKKFNEQHFLEDLMKQPWEQLYVLEDDPNAMWLFWKKLFMEVLDVHAPLQHKRVKSKKVPWLTKDLKEHIRNRDKLKKKAMITKTEIDWSKYKHARNMVNIKIRKVKSDYYQRMIADQKHNPKKAWKIINNLLGRNSKDRTVNELTINGNNTVVPDEIADGFNNYFTNIGENLADSMSNSEQNFADYVKITNARFTSFETISVDKVINLLNGLSNSKATGIDNISIKILKIASPVISTSITHIFNQLF